MGTAVKVPTIADVAKLTVGRWFKRVGDAVSIDEPDYGAYLNWLHFGEATLTFPQALVLRYSKLEPQERRSPQVATDYAKWFFGRLRAVEAAVANSEMLCGGRFTVADISVGYALLLAERIGLARDFGPAVAAYWQRLQQRDGFCRAVQAEAIAGIGFTGPCGSSTLFLPSGSVCSLPLTWHMEQFAKSLVAPVGLIAGNSVQLKSLWLPPKPTTT